MVYVLFTGLVWAVFMSVWVTELKTIPQILSTQVFGPTEFVPNTCWSCRNEFVAQGILIQSLAHAEETSVPVDPAPLITLPDRLNDIGEEFTVKQRKKIAIVLKSSILMTKLRVRSQMIRWWILTRIWTRRVLYTAKISFSANADCVIGIWKHSSNGFVVIKRR